MPLRNPVITGTGIISAVGCGVDSTWEAIRNHQSGLGPLTLFSSPRYAAHLVGQVRLDVNARAGTVRGSRSDKLIWIAAQEALASAELATGLGGLQPEKVGVALGCTVGGMLGSEQFLSRLIKNKQRRFGALRVHECANATDLCARHLGALGPCTTVSTACSAGAMAIATAAEWIEENEADLVLAGAGDSLCRFTLNGFGSLLLLDPNGCRPFDAERAGISLGEGAGMLVIEAEESARNRGAPILARISGWGASCDAWHATAPQPEGDGALSAMRQALARAGLDASEIDYVSAHGTGTPDNDAMEAHALRRLFGDRLPPVSSIKGFFGHTLAASGAIKAVINVKALSEQALPPNPGFEHPDPKLGLLPVNQYRDQSLTHVLSSSFGFGGNNAALVISHPDTRQNSRSEKTLRSATSETPTALDAVRSEVVIQAPPREPTRLAVVGRGVVSSAGTELSEIQAAFKRGGAATSLCELPLSMSPDKVPAHTCGIFGAEQWISPLRRRKLNRLQQMALVTALANSSLQGDSVSLDRVCVALGTGLGSLNDTAAFTENMILKEERGPRPMFFTNSVHNALASQVAIELKTTGLNTTPIQREISFETALWLGAKELALDQVDHALVGAADELSPYLLAAGFRWGWWNLETTPNRPWGTQAGERQRAFPGEGAAVFTLATANQVTRPLAFVSSIRIGRVDGLEVGRFDAQAEAQWIQSTLERSGESLNNLELLLTGANGWPWLDRMYLEVAQELEKLTKRPIPCGAYKQCCGEHHSASAFGFYTAIGIARGEISPAPSAFSGDPPHDDHEKGGVVLYTLSPTGTKGMCYVCA